MRRYYNGKKYISNLQGAITYETDMVEIQLLKKPAPEKMGTYPYSGFFEYENEKYSLELEVLWSEDDEGELYLDYMDFVSCSKIEEIKLALLKN